MIIERAMKAFGEMAPGMVPLVIDGGCDGLQPEEVFKILQGSDSSNGLVVIGRAHGGDLIGVDTYDLVTKFAEDRNFSKIRQRKDEDGWFAVVMVP